MVKKSPFDAALDEMRAELRRELLAEFAGMPLAEVAAAISAGGVVRAKPGRKPGTASSASASSGLPHGEVYSEGGKGRKQCPNCQKYLAARGSDCANCGYNFQAGKVLTHENWTAPYYAKGGKKKPNGSVPAADVDAQAVEKSAIKHLKKAQADGITVQSLISAVSQELDKAPSAVAEGVKSALKSHGSKVGGVGINMKWAMKGKPEAAAAASAA